MTGNAEVYKAYASSRNKERYLKRRRDEFVSMSLDDEKTAFVLKSDSNVEEEVEKRIRIELVRKAVRELPEDERKLICEYFFEDISLRRIAKRYGVSHTYISGRISDILIKLRQYITDKNN
ncbi:MAG: sigma-70 family RNA polymerase sigma factor [Alistipes sp.]|nr:sigma-70 family RNA polymerase sigma factor [Alistipes sp.]